MSDERERPERVCVGGPLDGTRRTVPPGITAIEVVAPVSDGVTIARYEIATYLVDVDAAGAPILRYVVFEEDA